MRAISAVVGLVLLAAVTAAQGAGRASPSLLKSTFSKLPIYLIENRGVYPDEAAFYVQGADSTLFFTKDGITFRLKGKDRCWVVKLEFVGANPDVVPRGEDKREAVFSYFKGPEKDWKTGLRTYGKVVYQDLWPGIDLVYRGAVNQLKYEFVVDPGADPSQIRLRYCGATSVERTAAGALRVVTPAGSFEDAPPVAYQEVKGDRVEVAVAFELDRTGGTGAAGFSFDIARYDRTRPLILDPAILVYCGYIGGSSFDAGYGIAVDRGGSVYVTGETSSPSSSFPVKVGPELQQRGWDDAFVAKVNPQGNGLVYCGYIGGTEDDYAYDIAVDSQGNAYVAGETECDENSFPVKVGPDTTFNGRRDYDAFVAKVDPQGQLVYCGYIGGARDDVAWAIDVDSQGNAYVTGDTVSDQTTFPVKAGPDLTYNDSSSRYGDAFVARVNASGAFLDYCGYIGGSGSDHGNAISADASGIACVCGGTSSSESSFPVKGGPDLTYNGGFDAYVAKVDPKGQIAYCGYIGGSRLEDGVSVHLDAAGFLYVTGVTQSKEGQEQFPVKAGPDLTFNGQDDAFVAKLDSLGQFVYCGYIGGSGIDLGWGIAVDAAGNAIVAGVTDSSQASFPVAVGPDLTYNGGNDAFVARVNSQGTGLDFCGYIGGSGNDDGEDVVVDATGNTYVVGWTSSGTTGTNPFPVKVGPGLTYSGWTDAYVAKIALVLLTGQGSHKTGTTVTLNLTASDSAGFAYQAGSSFGTGPIPIGNRKLGLSPDNLLVVTVNDYWPWIFSGYRGTIGVNGQAQAAIHIPNVPVLIGVRLHSAFVTLDPAAPSGIRSISNTFSFSVTT